MTSQGWMNRVHLYDDRGKPHAIKSPFFSSNATPDSVYHHRLTVFRREANRPLSLRSRSGALLIVGAVLGLLGVTTIYHGGFSRDGVLFLALASISVTAALIWSARLKSQLAAMESIRHTKLSHCPICRYAFSGIAPAEDGCTVCPECGAAWKIGIPRESC